ncbi:hypothetical protein ACQ4PT_023936 [Festuca glaucescens]
MVPFSDARVLFAGASAGPVSMSLDHSPTGSLIEYNDDIEEAMSPNRSVAAVAVKDGDASVYKIIHGFLKQKNNSIIRVAAKVAKKAASNKLSRKTSDVFDTLIQQQQSKWGNKTGPLLSGISYCIASCSMILLNKVVLSSYNFNAGVSLMLYQNLISVVILLALELFSVISTEQLTWKLIKVWIPVNLIFVGMLVTGMYSEVIREPMFWFFATASGLLGLAISFSSVWFLQETGPTTYSLVGSLNKIPISVAGVLLFQVPVSVENLFSIVFGLFAGIFFAKAKMSKS